jgi:pimeloyl-ACP methyl ester carboxylesterase
MSKILSFNLIKNKTSHRNPPLLILHGLYGSKENWKSLSKAFHRILSTDIYSLDLRNHGSSFHLPSMSLMDMADDVAYFIKSHNLSNVNIIGHSLGGKVAMKLTLMNPTLINKLVIVDISPLNVMSNSMVLYAEKMIEIEKLEFTNKKDVDKELSKIVPDMGTKLFLLKNLISTPLKDTLKFRVNLTSILTAIKNHQLSKFDDPPSQPLDTKSLLIYGLQSSYVDNHGMKKTKEYFNNITFHGIHAGHWVHSDNPTEFLKVSGEFLKC